MLSGNLFALLALVVWGFWGLFSKLATQYIHPSHAAAYEVVGAAMVALCIVIYAQFKLDTNPLGVFYAILTGICMSLGGVLFLMALSRGNAYVVTMLTSLYPIVTLLLLFLVFRESITIRQAVGMVFAACAVILLAL